MNLKFWKKRKSVSPCDEKAQDAAAMEALQRAQTSLNDGVHRLQEIRARKRRLEIIRRDNHLTPAILKAFRGESHE